MGKRLIGYSDVIFAIYQPSYTKKGLVIFSCPEKTLVTHIHSDIAFTPVEKNQWGINIFTSEIPVMLEFTGKKRNTS